MLTTTENIIPADLLPDKKLPKGWREKILKMYKDDGIDMKSCYVSSLVHGRFERCGMFKDQMYVRIAGVYIKRLKVMQQEELERLNKLSLSN